MANPNIRNLTTLKGDTALANLTTVLSDIVINPIDGNKLYKIVNLSVSNITELTNVSVTVNILRNEVSYALARSITIPLNATLLIVGKDYPVYMLEGDTLQARASADNSLQVVCSYEVVG